MYNYKTKKNINYKELLIKQPTIKRDVSFTSFPAGDTKSIKTISVSPQVLNSTFKAFQEEIKQLRQQINFLEFYIKQEELIK